jgi:hypothetical protein
MAATLGGLSRPMDSSDRGYSFFEQLFLDMGHSHMHQICDWGLFLGDAVAAQNLELIRQHGISHIVCCHPTLPFKFEREGVYIKITMAFFLFELFVN